MLLADSWPPPLIEGNDKAGKLPRLSTRPCGGRVSKPYLLSAILPMLGVFGSLQDLVGLAESTFLFASGGTRVEIAIVGFGRVASLDAVVVATTVLGRWRWNALKRGWKTTSEHRMRDSGIPGLFC